MANRNSFAKVQNPLTMVSIFAAISEVAMAYVITKLSDNLQQIFIWFVMGFPTVLVIIFFFILYKKPAVFFSPGDYQKEELYVSSIGIGKIDNTSEQRIKGLEDTLNTVVDYIDKKTDKKKTAEAPNLDIRESIQRQQDLEENNFYAFLTRELKIDHSIAQKTISAAESIQELALMLNTEINDQSKIARINNLIRAFPESAEDFKIARRFIKSFGES